MGELKNGIPWPEFFGSVQKTIGLYGYEQAHALAWAFAASAAYGMDNLDLRVKVYRIRFDIQTDDLTDEIINLPSEEDKKKSLSNGFGESSHREKK
jgi:hypothetical protein